MASRETIAGSVTGSPSGDPRWARDVPRSMAPMVCAVLCLAFALCLAIFVRSETDAPKQFSTKNTPVATDDTVASAITLPAPISQPERDAVSRAAVSLVDFSLAAKATPKMPVRHAIRRPVRLVSTDNRTHDLGTLTARALSGLGYVSREDDGLARLLVVMLSEWQDDSYIDAVLRAAHARGEISVPRQMITPTGDINAPLIRAAIVATALGKPLVRPTDHTGDALVAALQ